MTRSRIAIALAASLAFLSAQSIHADVRSEQKTKFQLAGMLGKMVNFFGGKAAREGVTSTVAVKGDRKVTTTDQTGQIIDLAEEKIYDLDLKRKTYKVTTFADVRRQMEEAKKKAEEEARKAEAETKAEPAPPAERDPNAKEMEVDFEVKNTGQKKAVNGFDSEQSIMTITVREKDKTLEQSGGLVLTSDIWLTPSIPALNEVAEFDIRYAQKLYGPMIAGASPQDMATAMAMYPLIKPAVEKMAAEAGKLKGTPVLTVTTFDAVKSAEQVAAEQQQASSGSASSDSSTPPTSVSGIIGGLGRRIGRRNDQAAAAPQARVNVMTTTSEVLKVATTVTPEEVAIPAGFKETK